MVVFTDDPQEPAYGGTGAMSDNPNVIKEIIKAAILAEQCPDVGPGSIEDCWLIPYGEGAAAERCEYIAEAVIDALSSVGLKVVPEKATTEIQQAMATAFHNAYESPGGAVWWANIWRDGVQAFDPKNRNPKDE